jgi:hypothetical protein
METNMPETDPEKEFAMLLDAAHEVGISTVQAIKFIQAFLMLKKASINEKTTTKPS